MSQRSRSSLDERISAAFTDGSTKSDDVPALMAEAEAAMTAAARRPSARGRRRSTPRCPPATWRRLARRWRTPRSDATECRRP